MSLQIWLPLNKSGVNGGLLNYGLYDIGDSSKSYNHGMTAVSTSNDYYQSTTAPNYLCIEHENVKQWNGSFSFSIRLRIDSWNTNWETYVYAGQGGAAWNQYIFGLSRTDANSGLQFVIGDGNATTQTNCNVTGLSTGVWYHFACTYQPGVVKIYKDGVLVKSVNTGVVPNFSLINYFLIGAVNTSGTYQTKSSYQDFRLYDHTLSDAEVKHIYDSISTSKQDTSLAVWLPLTKDTHNQGTDNSGSFASTTAWANEGKVGAKALLSNANLTATFDNLKNVTNFSLCFWIKVDSSLDINAWQDIVELDVMTGSSAGQVRPEFTNTKGQFQVLIGKDTTVGNQYNYYGVNGNIGITATQFVESAKDKWAHCVIAKDDNYSYTYLNGTLVNQSTSTAYEKSPQKLTGVMHLGWTQSTAAMVNDVRVYTKCLSADEVKKIAQGLVLHYTMSNPYIEYATNLLPDDLRNMSINGTGDAGRYSVDVKETGPYTLSGYMTRSSKDDEWTAPRSSIYLKYTDGSSDTYSSVSSHIIKDDKEHYFSVTVFPTTGKTIQNVHGWIFDHSSTTNKKYVKVRDAVLQYGDHATLYDPKANLVPYDLTKWSKESVGAIELQSDGYYKISSIAENENRYGIYYDLNLAPNKTYTFTADVRDDWLIGVNPDTSFVWTSANLNSANVSNKTAQTVSHTFTTTIDKCKCRIYIAGINTSNRVTYVKNVKFSFERFEYDISGFGNNVAYTGSLETDKNAQRYLGSTKFNGSSSDMFSASPRLGLIGDCEFTMSAWIYWAGNTWGTNIQGIIWNNNTAVNHSAILSTYNGHLNFDFWGLRFVSNNQMTVQNWHHVAATKVPGIMSADTCKLYIDGVNVSGYCGYDSTSFQNMIPTIADNGIVVGRLNPVSGRWFNGNISDIRIYTTALSAEEIQELYNMGRS